MICDRCYYKDKCLIRKAGGKHISDCDDFFPDLTPAKSRTPASPMTPEARRQPMETRG